MKRRLLIVVIGISVGFLTTTIFTLINDHKTMTPDNTFIHKELVIRDAGKYTSLYVDEISKDRGSQQFGLSFSKKRKDLYINILAHENSKKPVNEFMNWLISYYGAVIQE